MILGQHQKTSGDFTYDPHFGDLNVADYYRPYNKDDWYQTALTVEGKISNWDITYTGGYFCAPGRQSGGLFAVLGCL